jgi:hypothetical protein
MEEGDKRAKLGKGVPPTNTNPRLQELLNALVCLDDIAPSDTPLIAKRAGELIARSAITRLASPQKAELETEPLRDSGTDPPNLLRRARIGRSA